MVMFVVALVMLRVAHKRFFARRNALDVLLALVLASMLSRAINGTAAFVPTIAGGFALVFLHRLTTWCAARVPWFSRVVKGRTTELVTAGSIERAALLRHDLSEEDLREDLRLAGADDIADVRRATLERNGKISVVKK